MCYKIKKTVCTMSSCLQNASGVSSHMSLKIAENLKRYLLQGVFSLRKLLSCQKVN